MSRRPLPTRRSRRPSRLTLVGVAAVAVLAGCGPGASAGPTAAAAASTASAAGVTLPPSATPSSMPTPSPAPTPSPSPSPAPSRAASGALDPCSLLTTDEAAAALGVPSVTAVPEVPTVTAPPGVDSPGFCAFRPVSGPGSVEVGVETVAPQMVVFGLQGTPVAGLGQQAIVGGGVIGVLVSDALGLSIRVSMSNGTMGSDAVLKDLARKAVARAS